MADGDEELTSYLERVVPGSPLRDGLDRIVRSHLGALVVLDDSPLVLTICSGGFHIDAEMTPQRLSELAKMDGAIVLDREARRIAWANVHLIPDPSTPTTETGTRHRTAERVARSTGVGVVSVSEEAGTITLYAGEVRRQLQDTDSLIVRANHLLQTLERFRARSDDVLADLDRAELEDSVSIGKVATILQRLEMVVRVARSIGELVTELGSHRRLLRLQLGELVSGVFEERRLVVLDYVATEEGDDLEAAADAALARLNLLSPDQLLVLEQVAAALGVRDGTVDLDAPLVPRGRRLLRHLPHVSLDTVDGLVAHFGDLARLQRASLDELVAYAGETDAALLRSGLDRLALGVDGLHNQLIRRRHPISEPPPSSR